MVPNLESCALTRGKCPYVAARISQALIDKLQIIERYNHRTKRCRVLSQDDGTSSSDRRAIECPKAGNVRKTRQCAHRSPSVCSSSPRIRFWGGMRCCGRMIPRKGFLSKIPLGEREMFSARQNWSTVKLASLTSARFGPRAGLCSKDTLRLHVYSYVETCITPDAQK